MIVNETIDVIRRRRSVRSFTDEQLREEELRAIVEAGLYAPNCGDQAWHFSVVQNPDLLDRLNRTAKETAVLIGDESLRMIGSNEKHSCLFHAPTLIIVSARDQSPMSLETDCAAAMENMLIAAESVGVGACWIFFVMMAFFSPQGEELRRELQIPDGYKPYCAAVFGHRKTAPAPAPERKPGLVSYI